MIIQSIGCKYTNNSKYRQMFSIFFFFVLFQYVKELLSRMQSQACLGYAEAMVFLGVSQRTLSLPKRGFFGEQEGGQARPAL